MQKHYFLKDLKVIELASVLAGPAVGMFLAEMGAQVIKVENPVTGGDVTRSWKLASEDKAHPISAYFCAVNVYKEHLFLNLSNPEDRSRLEVLLREADVLLMNFKQGDDKRFDLEPGSLLVRFPKLIVGNISGFRSMPSRTAYDVVIQAECGFMGMNGTPDSGPIKLPVALMDLLAAHQLKEGVLVALLARTKTGKGAFVNASLEEAAIASLANQATNYLMNNHTPGRIGSLHPNISPYGEVVSCSDGKEVVLAVGSDSQFRSLCTLLGHPELATDLRFLSNSARVANRKELHKELSNLFILQDRDEILTKLIEHNVPAGAIRMLDEVLESDLAKFMTIETDETGRTGRRITSLGFTIQDVDQI